MAKTSKYIRVKGWKKNPLDMGPKDKQPPFLRYFGWKLNPAWKPAEPTLKNIKIDDYVTGGVVPVRKVPKKHRKQYRDTMARFALACHRAGYGPGGNKGKRWVNSTYRFYEEQLALYNLNMVSRGVPKPGRPLTAYPGTSSHERAKGIDAPNVREEKALIVECRKLELKDDVPSEKWHLTSHASVR